MLQLAQQIVATLDRIDSRLATMVQPRPEVGAMRLK
jgi:hypothetical protein